MSSITQFRLILICLLILHVVLSDDDIIAGVCEIIAATSVGDLIYTEWKCDKTGQPITNPCGDPIWRGITCVENSNKISQIDLADKHMIGTIPEGIGKLSDLILLKLGSNHLHATLPWELGYLTNLIALDLHQNEFSGVIFSNIGGMVELQLLLLSENSLQNAIPTGFGELSSLQSLYLNDNKLSHGLPDFDRLVSLEVFYASGNKLTGNLPSSLALLNKLRELVVGNNNFHGHVPSFLGGGGMSSLRILDLGSCFFSGPISTELATLPKLEQLWLLDNQLTGTIPTALANLTNLVYLYLNENLLWGSAPSELGALTGLQQLLLGSNCLSGVVPSSWDNLQSLVYYDISDNHLTSPVFPAGIVHMPGLVFLGLRGNSIGGSIPSNIGVLTNLLDFIASETGLGGSLPSSISSLKQLEFLLLSNNHLTGPIPLEIGSCVNLWQLNLDGNILEGPIPSTLGNLTFVGFLSLNDNCLTGTIPAAVGCMSNMQYLNLNTNEDIRGPIPSSLGSLSRLVSLQLYKNKLTGTVPLSLYSPSHLSYVDIHSNHLSGHLRLLNHSNILNLNLSANYFTGTLPVDISSSLGTLNIADNIAVSGTIPTVYGSSSSGLHNINIANTKIGGVIPSDFCATEGVSIDVTGSNIACYSGCLTSAAVLVQGASPECHNGTVLRDFLVFVAIIISIVAIISLFYQQHRGQVMKGADLSVWNPLTHLQQWQQQPSDRLTMALPSYTSFSGISNNSTDSAVRDRSSRAVIILSFVKFILAVVVSLTLNNWWTFTSNNTGNMSNNSGANSDSANNFVVESCSNPTIGHCYSVCGDIEIVSVEISDDDYVFTQTIPPSVITYTHNSTASYCVANFRQDCAYRYWLVMKLVPILFHLLGFLLQFVTLRFKRDFNPQQRQYDVIISYLYPDIDGDEGRRSLTSITAIINNNNNSKKKSSKSHEDSHDQGQDHDINASESLRQQDTTSSAPTLTTYSAMLSELLASPSSSVFVFIEVLTVIYVWGELWFPPVYCGATRPLSLYYYPILMSLLDLTKFNLYVATRLRSMRRNGEAFCALLSLEIFLTNMWISVVLAIMFVVTWLNRLYHLIVSSKCCHSVIDATRGVSSNNYYQYDQEEQEEYYWDAKNVIGRDFDGQLYSALKHDIGYEHGLKEELLASPVQSAATTDE